MTGVIDPPLPARSVGFISWGEADARANRREGAGLRKARRRRFVYNPFPRLFKPMLWNEGHQLFR